MNVGNNNDVAMRADLRFLIGFTLGMFFAGLVSCVFPEEVDMQQKIYCENVRDGHWPDYAETYKAECGGKDPPKFNANLMK